MIASDVRLLVPPDADDVLLAARALAWPRVAVKYLVIRGERDWRRVLAAADTDTVIALRDALPSAPTVAADDSNLYTRYPPTPAEEAVFWRGVLLAREHGVTVAPGICECYWADLVRPMAGLTFTRCSPIIVLIHRGLDERDMLAAVVHEIQHVFDAGDLSLTPDEREARADRFVARVLGPSNIKGGR